MRGVYTPTFYEAYSVFLYFFYFIFLEKVKQQGYKKVKQIQRAGNTNIK